MAVPATTRVLSAVVSKLISVLSNPTSGFNAQFLQTISQPPYAGVVGPATIDFTGTNKQFFTEKVNIAEYVRANPNIKFPIVAIWAESSLPLRTGMLKHAVFSGTVLIAIDLYVSWPNQTHPIDFGPQVDAYVDTLYSVLQTPGGPNENALTAGPIYHLSELSVRGKTAASPGDRGWSQSVSLTTIFKVQF